MAKKILVVDDSALMRSVLCDIINSDERFEVADQAFDGVHALDLLSRNTYDAVVLDINMPRMDGLQLLRKLRDYKISARVMMASTDTKEGTKDTLDALELGALDFVHKPDRAKDYLGEDFKRQFLNILSTVSDSRAPSYDRTPDAGEVRQTVTQTDQKPEHRFNNVLKKVQGKKLVAIASSTGGPKALNSVIPMLPKDIDAPILVVQHMPVGFTASLAERLDGVSAVNVREAAEGMELKRGTVYVAMSGKHMKVVTSPAGKSCIHYTDEPNREGVKPCANYLYESLIDSEYDNIVCVVMTGMGADGTEGIRRLKSKKNIHVISQSQDTCTIYGMPKNIEKAGLQDQIVPLEQIAQEITMRVGITSHS